MKTIHSFLQLSELGHRGDNENDQTLKWCKGDPNPGSLDCESGILPLSYRTPQVLGYDTKQSVICKTFKSINTEVSVDKIIGL